MSPDKGKERKRASVLSRKDKAEYDKQMHDAIHKQSFSSNGVAVDAANAIDSARRVYGVGNATFTMMAKESVANMQTMWEEIHATSDQYALKAREQQEAQQAAMAQAYADGLVFSTAQGQHYTQERQQWEQQRQFYEEQAAYMKRLRATQQQLPTLPHGWTVHHAPNHPGRPYYYHQATDTSQWDAPHTPLPPLPKQPYEHSASGRLAAATSSLSQPAGGSLEANESQESTGEDNIAAIERRQGAELLLCNNLRDEQLRRRLQDQLSSAQSSAHKRSAPSNTHDFTCPVCGDTFDMNLHGLNHLSWSWHAYNSNCTQQMPQHVRVTLNAARLAAAVKRQKKKASEA
jgi:hypothetical protein